MFNLTEIWALLLFHDVPTEFYPAFTKFETLRYNKLFLPTLVRIEAASRMQMYAGWVANGDGLEGETNGGRLWMRMPWQMRT